MPPGNSQNQMERTMKKTVAALALSAILIPAAVIAGSHYGDRGENRAERMAEHLQLSEQQQSEVQKIFEEQRAKRKEQRQQMRTETQARLNKVLTPEQQAKWQEYRKDRKDRFCDKHGKGERYEHGKGDRYGRDDD